MYGVTGNVFQETLLELKTRNYTLEDQSRKQRNALGDATAKVTVLQQELSKAQKTIEKSRKITEVQKVINENDNLHKKILAQEEDFRLQNQTLLNELSLVSHIHSHLSPPMVLYGPVWSGMAPYGYFF